MTSSDSRVWLNGERFDVAYLLETTSGSVQRHVRKGQRTGQTAGMGQRIGRHFVAVYVDPNSAELVLQIGHLRFPLDGSVLIGHVIRNAGLTSRLIVGREGQSPLIVRQTTVARAILRRIDPTYDDLDESCDDFLADVADIAHSPERRRWILETKNPTAGPWEDVL